MLFISILAWLRMWIHFLSDSTLKYLLLLIQWMTIFRSKHVIAIDIDPKRIDLAQYNAAIYGVGDQIDFIRGDSFVLAPYLKVTSFSIPKRLISYIFMFEVFCHLLTDALANFKGKVEKILCLAIEKEW